MTPPARALMGSKQKRFRGSAQLRPRGSNASDFSRSPWLFIFPSSRRLIANGQQPPLHFCIFAFLQNANYIRCIMIRFLSAVGERGSSGLKSLVGAIVIEDADFCNFSLRFVNIFYRLTHNGGLRMGGYRHRKEIFLLCLGCR